MNHKDYLMHPAMSNSKLKKFAENPCAPLNEFTTSDAMRFGQLVDCLLLSPDKFKDEFKILNMDDRPNKKFKMGKDNEEWLSSLRSSSTPLVEKDEVDQASFIVEQLLKDSFIKEIVTNGIIHPVYFWIDPSTGIDMKLELDILYDNKIYDLKTTKSIYPPFFVKDVKNYYRLQPAIYIDGVIANGEFVEAFEFLAVDKEYADYNFFPVDDSFIEQGRKEYKHHLKGFKDCRESNIWTRRNIDINTTIYA